MIFSQFSLYAVSPIVIVNVLDPNIHNEAITNQKENLDGYSVVLDVDGVLLDTVTVKNATGDEYEAGVHYTLSFDRNGFPVLTAKEGVAGGMSENEQLEFAFTKLAPEKVDIWDFIGGYDVATGKNFGMELVNEIFPLFRRVPGQILAPGVSGDPTLAAVMETRASNINGNFRAVALIDIPTMVEDGGGNLIQHRFTNVPAFKNQNNFVFPGQINCYPKLRLGELIFNFSTQLAGLIGRTDFENSSTPYVSPSNKNLRINGLCYADGEEVSLGVEQANFLNENGIVAAINFTNGWVCWGSQTGAFPGNTDPKDAFIPIRRMFIWVGNTIVLTYWRKIGFPLIPRVIETIVDSLNIWLNGLASRQFILGGRVEFLQDDNPQTALLSGNVIFRVRISPPPPLQSAEFILQYDPEYLNVLFG
jgi:phage tail sheath protein FI